MSDTAGVGAFLAAVAGLSIIFMVVFVALWVLKSIGLAQMAKKRGIENEWLAWLPIADLYIMGSIVEEMNLFGMQINNLGLWFPVVSLVGGLLGGIPVLGIILFIGVLIFQIAFIYNLFKLYTDQSAIYTVLCVFFAFLFPIFIFALRNNSVLSPQNESAPQEDPSSTEPTLKQEDSFSISAVNLDEKQEEVCDEEEETRNLTAEKTDTENFDH